MKRIGIAASKISKGSLALYNVYVVLISFIFSLFMFIAAGTAVLFALMIISYLGNEVLPGTFQKDMSSLQNVCMAALTVVIVVFNLIAVCLNIKVSMLKDK